MKTDALMIPPDVLWNKPVPMQEKNVSDTIFLGS